MPTIAACRHVVSNVLYVPCSVSKFNRSPFPLPLWSFIIWSLAVGWQLFDTTRGFVIVYIVKVTYSLPLVEISHQCLPVWTTEKHLGTWQLVKQSKRNLGRPVLLPISQQKTEWWKFCEFKFATFLVVHQNGGTPTGRDIPLILRSLFPWRLVNF